jgi:hypothetical protein
MDSGQKKSIFAFFDRINICLDEIERIDRAAAEAGVEFSPYEQSQETIFQIQKTIERTAIRLSAIEDNYPEDSVDLLRNWNDIVKRCERLGVFSKQESN